MAVRRGPHDRVRVALGRADAGRCTGPGQHDVADRARRLRVRVSARGVGGLPNDGAPLPLDLWGHWRPLPASAITWRSRRRRSWEQVVLNGHSGALPVVVSLRCPGTHASLGYLSWLALLAGVVIAPEGTREGWHAPGSGGAGAGGLPAAGVHAPLAVLPPRGSPGHGSRLGGRGVRPS